MKNPSIREIKEYIRQKKGEYGAKRVQRAADEIPNLENLYTSEALKHAFGGDNAQAMMTMNPADFESYASPIPERTRHWPSNGESTPDKANLPTADYIHYLQSVGKFNDVPYLELNKEEAGLPLTPFISGHEGRHRSRAMAKAGQKQGLVRMLPRAELREPFPRRHQEDYIEAMKKELAMTNGLVLPQRYSESKDDGWTETPIRRPAIKLPDIYANGGIIHKGGEVEDDYRGEHTAPGPHYGAPLHDVSSNGMYPADFYGPMGRRYYANEGWDFDQDAYNKVTRVKGKPNEMVSIHRAVPTSVYKEALKKESPLKHMIRKGDWVAINKEYAKSHGKSALNGNYKIASMRVPAKHVWTNADSIHEWGYHPEEEKKAKGGNVMPDITKAKGGIISQLRRNGKGVSSELEAMRRMSQGHRVFVTHEQDERPREITSVRELYAYTPDQMYTLAPEAKAKGGKVDVRPTVSYSSGSITHKANGGLMDTTNSLAKMRLEMGRHKNPEVMGNIGVNEAVDIDPKIFVNPNPNSPGLPDVGGVKTPDGALPVGGVDMNPQQAGQQMMPQAPQAPQALQQGQPQGAPQSMAPEGSGAPQDPSNILSLTPQGQAMNAMRPPQGPMAQKMAKGGQLTIAQMKNELHHFAQGGSEKDDGSSTRIYVPARGPNGVKGIKVPRHMWEGKVYGGVGPKKGQKVEGMKDINEARAEVYGSEHRQPLNIGQIGKAHRQALNEHFAKPLKEQIAAEKEALDRLKKAKHIGSKSNTLDKSEKLDTVRHETDDEGRTHVGYASKGVAGHALYTSGHGKDAEHHILNTCPGQTEGCGGGMDENGVVDTSKGTCFAPNAESQYVNAAVRRASHAQAKHDPAMTRDWILAHTGSLREAANQADKKNQRLLFRPNVVDETDTSSRHVLRHLNEQRKKDDKPPIIANSYGKTNELHDPENGYHVTHSNVGPKTKHGKEVSENIGRDKARVRNTVLAYDNKGHFTNEQGNKTPPKNSYMVTNVKRGSPFDKEMQNTITHAKYWSQGRPLNELNEMEKDEGEEGHYNAKGQRTTPDKSHYGHVVVNGNRYDYQKQHILHPRLVQVGTNKDGTPHMIPTDSRFLDNKELDKTIPREKQFKTRNGKRAGLILMTTPTESTPNHLHHSSFTHDVNPTHIEYAKKNNGEYEIDPPLAQEFSKGKEYVAPQPIKIMRKAKGGQVIGHKMEYNDDFNAFPEQDFLSQHHLAARRANKV